MALLYLEGFDKITNNTGSSSNGAVETYMARRCNDYNLVAGGDGGQVFTVNAFGGNGYCFILGNDNSGDAGFVELRALPGHATYITGIAVQPGNYLSANKGDISTGKTELMQWKNLTDGVTHITLWLVNGRHLQFTRGTSTDLCGIAHGVRPNIWQYLEIKITMANSPNGSIVVHRNGEEILNETGLDTRNGGTAEEFETIRLFGLDGDEDEANAQTYYDDWYICDGSGTDNNDFLGPVKVEALLPDGDDTSNWGARNNTVFDPPTTITNRYDLVNDVPQANDDLYVVESATASSSDQELFTVENLSLADGTFHGITVDFEVRNTGSSDSFKVVVENASNQDTGTSLTVADTNYGVAYHAAYDLAPNGGAGTAFTESIINALVIGCEKP